MAARRTERTQVTRETRVTSRKVEGQDTPGDDGEPKPGLGLADGICIVTTLVLLAAILMTDYLLGKHYGSGFFFKS